MVDRSGRGHTTSQGGDDVNLQPKISIGFTSTADSIVANMSGNKRNNGTINNQQQSTIMPVSAQQPYCTYFCSVSFHWKLQECVGGSCHRARDSHRMGHGAQWGPCGSSALMLNHWDMVATSSHHSGP